MLDKKSFFENVSNFNHDLSKNKLLDEETNVSYKCLCGQKHKRFKKGRFRINGKQYYCRSIFAPFWGLFKHYWQISLESIKKMAKDNIIPTPEMNVILKRGFMFSKVYIEAMPANYPKKQKSKLRQINEKFIFPKGILHSNTQFDALKRKLKKLHKSSSLKDKFQLCLKSYLSNKYEIWLYCPLCAEKEPNDIGYFL